MYSCDAKLYFQHHYSSLQCHMNLILICWFAAQEIIIGIINVEYSCAAKYFCGKCDTIQMFGVR